MKRLLLIVIVAGSSVFVSMCGKEDLISDGNETMFEGLVSDSVTGIPVESVKVNAIDTVPGFRVIFTDSSGFFDLIDISGHNQLPFFFRKDGYETALCTLTAGQRKTIRIQK